MKMSEGFIRGMCTIIGALLCFSIIGAPWGTIILILVAISRQIERLEPKEK